ncbi:ALF repeat-containing protein [Kitasatospora sp. NPDC101235]|uniref:ALF repeat-containing protein n=1 Tax=Kitasatospora sp. NPDC101235 TaxID=3364101 RepID=UPI003826A135
MKLPRVSAVVAAAVLAPAVLFPTTASAADAPKPTGVSGPDTGSDSVKDAAPEDGDGQEQRDRAEVERILADSPSWSKVRENAAKALKGGAAELRHFLTVELEESRKADNLVRVAQIEDRGGPAVKKAADQALRGTYQDVLDFLATGQYTARAEDEDRAKVEAILADPQSGLGVREAAEKALKGGAAELRHFLEVELDQQRTIDNRVKTAQIYSVGGPAVQKAARAALNGTDQDILEFLKTGQYIARAEDEDRAKVEAILADPQSGRGAREGAEKALKGGAAELRHFLEAELPRLRADDNRVKVSQLMSTGGPAVREAAGKALDAGTDEAVEAFLNGGFAKAQFEDDRVEILRVIADKESSRYTVEAAQKAMDGNAEAARRFLTVELPRLRASDNRVKVSQIIETGGPAVRKAALAAFDGSDADITAFLKDGWAKARAEDEAAAAKPGSGTGTGTDGSGQQPQTVQPAGFTETTGTETTTGTRTGTGTTGSGALASTGTDGLGWEAGGAAAALAAGAALVVAARRRSTES